jgi:hypothetical protein
MTAINLNATNPTILIGWMGSCPTTESINLTDSSVIPYIDKVVRIDKNSTGYDIFDASLFGGFFFFPPFQTLDPGYSYYIFLKPSNNVVIEGNSDLDPTSITLSGFVASDMGSDDGGRIGESCLGGDYQNSFDINLNATNPTILIGWMGSCPTTESINLTDSSVIPYIDKVVRIDKNSTGYDIFDASLFGGFFFFPPFQTLDPGYSYYIFLKPSNNVVIEGNSDLDPTSITLSGFVASDMGSDPRGLIASTCAPVTASCTCSAVVETGVLKVDFDATSLSGTTDGNIKGVEIVFDNVVFGESTHLSATPSTEVNKFKDTSNASTLNFYYDYSIRTDSVSDAPTNPKNTKSVIGFIDTTENGVGTTTTLLNTITFNVAAEGFTITGDDPTIADVRVYDSSASVVQYDITRCE